MKRFLCVLLSLILAILCVGCMKNGTGEKTDVVIWHSWNVEEGGGEHFLQVAAEEFNASQDEINVILESQPGSGFSKKVANAVANGVGPDIFFEFATTLPEYVEGGFAANMENYLDTDALKARMSEALWQEAWSVGDSHLHIVPIQVTVPVFFYNKALYEKHNLSVPKTWEELEQNCKILSEQEQIAGFATDSYIDLAQIFNGQLNQTYIDTETKTVGFRTEEFEAAVDWFAKCVDKKYFTATYSTGSLEGDFNAGLLASFIGTCSYEPYLVPDGFEYGVAKVPTLGAEPTVPLFNRGAIVMASDEKTEAAACKFIDFFTNAENSMKWSTTIGALTPYEDAAQLEEYRSYLETSDVLQVASESLPFAKTTPALKGALTVRSELKEMFLQTVGKVKTAKEAISIAETNCNNALK
ncbi:MAG: extracellular solute-binding protein [Clostridia bacterium]|nr:extracellular solute-binding protein [Clostridia bacterium]